MEHERKLGQNELIFPIYYIVDPVIENPILRQDDPLINELCKRQRLDWRGLRHDRDITSREASEQLAKFAEEITGTLRRVQGHDHTDTTEDAFSSESPSLSSSKTRRKKPVSPRKIKSDDPRQGTKFSRPEKNDDSISSEKKEDSSRIESGEPLQRFSERMGGKEDKGFVKMGLDTPKLQSCFKQMSFHNAFVEKFDPNDSYCFWAGEKTGKSSWLGFLSQHLLTKENLKGKYQPIWVDKFKENSSERIQITLVKWLNDQSFENNIQPVLVIDNIHTQPKLIHALGELRASNSEWKNIPLYCTFLNIQPEDENERETWKVSRSEWDQISIHFKERRRVLRSIEVLDSESNQTDDGEKIILAIQEELSKEAGEELRSMFKTATSGVPFQWISAFAVENSGRSIFEVKDWLRKYEHSMEPHEIFRKVWGKNERYQDILHTIAYLWQPSTQLVTRICSNIRGESEKEIKDALDKIMELGDLWKTNDSLPLILENFQYLSMQDSLSLFVKRTENFSQQAKERIFKSLVECIQPGTLDGEHAAIIALPEEDYPKNYGEALWKKISSLDWKSGREPFLYLVSQIIPIDAKLDQVKLLADLMLACSPEADRIAWVKGMMRIEGIFFNHQFEDYLQRCQAYIVKVLENEWEDEKSWLEAGYAFTEWYEKSNRWELALDWYEKMDDKSPESHNEITASIVNCLLQLGRITEAGSRASEENASIDASAKMADFFIKEKNWKDALLWLDRIIDNSKEQKLHDAAIREKVNCLLQLGQTEAAQSQAQAEDAPIEAAVKAANFFINKSEWENVLPWLKWIAEHSHNQELINSTIGEKVKCLLKLERTNEAMSLITEEGAPIEAFVKAAEFYLNKKDYQEALSWLEMIIQHSQDYRDSATGAKVNCLLQLEQVKEAMSLASEEGAPVEASIKMAEFYLNEENYKEALPWLNRIVDQSQDYRDSAIEKNVKCLLQLDRTEEALSLALLENDRIDASVTVANFYTHKKEWQEAIWWWLYIARRSPQRRRDAMESVVYCFLKLKRIKDAIKYAEVDNYPGSQAEIAEFFTEHNDYKKASVWWNKVLKNGNKGIVEFIELIEFFVIIDAWDRIETLDLIAKTREKISEDMKKGNPTAIRRNALLSLVNGDFQTSAKECQEHMREFGENDKEIAYVVILISAWLTNKKKLMKEMIKELNQISISPNDLAEYIKFAKGLARRYNELADPRLLQEFGDHKS